MIPTISNLKMENESVVSEKIKYAHLTEVEIEIETVMAVVVVTEIAVVVVLVAAQAFAKVTKWKPNALDGQSITKEKLLK